MAGPARRLAAARDQPPDGPGKRSTAATWASWRRAAAWNWPRPTNGSQRTCRVTITDACESRGASIFLTEIKGALTPVSASSAHQNTQGGNWIMAETDSDVAKVTVIDVPEAVGVFDRPEDLQQAVVPTATPADPVGLSGRPMTISVWPRGKGARREASEHRPLAVLSDLLGDGYVQPAKHPRGPLPWSEMPSASAQEKGQYRGRAFSYGRIHGICAGCRAMPERPAQLHGLRP